MQPANHDDRRYPTTARSQSARTIVQRHVREWFAAREGRPAPPVPSVCEPPGQGGASSGTSGGETPATIAHPPDAPQFALGAPLAQLVAEWTPGAQRALDGRYEAPAQGPSGEAASSELGPYTEFPAAPTQLPLPLDRFARLDVMAKYLRCRCPGGEEGEEHERNVKRGVCLNRCAKCCRVPFQAESDLPLFRTERGGFYFTGLVQCAHWTCPSCGARIARDVVGKVGCSIKAWLRRNLDGEMAAANAAMLRLPAGGRKRDRAKVGAAAARNYREQQAPHDVWLFTPTITHYAEDSQEVTIARLFEAWERFTESRQWKAWKAKVGLCAHVRAFDATFLGKNGTHPHFHVALFVDGVPGFRHAAAIAKAIGGSKGNAFEVPASLVDAWQRACERAGVTIKNAGAFRETALQLQGGDEAAAYFTKWGLASEATATGLKSEGPLALLDLAGAGDHAAGELYRSFCIAMRGRQAITGLGDMLRVVGVTEDDIEAYREQRQAELDKREPPQLVAPLSLVVRRCLWRTACAVGLGAVVAEVSRADSAGENAQEALDGFLFAAAREIRHDPELLTSKATSPARRAEVAELIARTLQHRAVASPQLQLH